MKGSDVTLLSFQLLDVSYEMRGSTPVIILWGRGADGSRVVVFYDEFRPYFYVLPDGSVSLDQLAAMIRRLSRPSSPILSVERVRRRFIGREVEALKVTTLVPASVREYREAVRRLGGVRDVLEADIPFALRFIIDFNLYPMRWYVAEVREVAVPHGYSVDRAYTLSGDIREDETRIQEDPLKGLRVMAFDIEVYSKMRTPDPKKDPVIMIGLQQAGGEIEILEAEDGSDKKVIAGFVERVKSIDPDVIVGYNQNRFDWPYLVERARVLGVKLAVGRRSVEPQPGLYGHYSVSGRLNVDLLDFAEELHEVKVKTLEEVADYLGVVKIGERVTLEWWQIGEYWDDPSKREILRKYLRDDVRSTIGLAEKFLPFGAQLSQVSGLPLDQVMAASVGFRLEWRLIREAAKLGELVPNRVERSEGRYAGAIVLRPKPGVHEDIAVLDFASMYPNIMVKYNVGPDTLVRPGEEYRGEEVYTAPEVGHKFRKSPPGFFKKILERFLSWRRQIRSEMKKHPPESPEYKLLDERQKAIKLLANASYGYMGWPHARWYCRECAEAVTAWGRSIIRTAIKKAGELGLEVIYGDTDSLFVKNDPEKVERLIRFVEEELGFDIKVDKVYRRVFFTEAKKRYVGLTVDGKIDVVGFEAVRGDWSELAKETQFKVAEIVLKTGSVDEAVDYVRNIIEKLRRGQVDLRKLVIWKTLTRPPSMYEARQPHVTAALLMEKAGIRVEPGAKIGYVVTKGSGPLYTRAKPYFMASREEVDVEYYVDKQVVPAALRILQYFGVTEKRLKGGGRQSTLLDFMRRGK
ncbi:DNA polymerase 2 [Aeropyrum pernix]|uniref:DNA polymerase n=1 Tax=Aeropyrum pernix TaxID=56636 RepID=A0A401HAK7_AERPX|nr:DNA polymerase II [Aeropyrum pernix]GBF09424.1 DNA polymerase 2 [Aeropyrum pernix]